ncbi:MAG: hypothetical protein JO372_09655, partial [Solirubrobacterales bacterium]|nr:hypothetical protein [Solirubrobacterales bacterium]
MNSRALVYGVITVGALLAAESGAHETYARTVIAVVIALLMYWLAHSYAELLGRRLDQGTALKLAALANTMRSELSILTGAAVPLVAVLISWALGAKLTTAVDAGARTSAVMILLIEILAGIRADLSGKELAKQASIGA